MTYENLLDVVDELEKKWVDMMEGFNQNDDRNHPAHVFDTHMDLVTLALFVWDFPSRKEKFELQFENKPKNGKPTEEGNFVNVSNDTNRVIIHFNTEKKKPVMPCTSARALHVQMCSEFTALGHVQ